MNTHNPGEAVFKRTEDQLKSCAEQCGRPASVERLLLETSLRILEAAHFMATHGSITGVRQRLAEARGASASDLELVVSRACALLAESTRIWSATGPRPGHLNEMSQALAKLATDLRVRAAAAADGLDAELQAVSRLRDRVAELGERVLAADSERCRLSEESEALERRLEEASLLVSTSTVTREHLLIQIRGIEQLQRDIRGSEDAVGSLERRQSELNSRLADLRQLACDLEQKRVSVTRDLDSAGERLSATRALVEALRKDPRAEISREVQRVWDALPPDRLDRLMHSAQSAGVPAPPATDGGS